MTVTTDRTSRLRELLAAPEILVLPGVVDPWAARLASQAGFPALFATGAGIANVSYGLPDLGLLGMDEMTAAVGRICRSVDIPVVADGDAGYGNALNVYRSAQNFIAAGAAGVTLEDQVNPKRCGHLAGKSVVPVDEMVEKIVAFREAKGSDDTVLIARTDAIAVEGFDRAIQRARAYVEAGADVLFVEAPTDVEQLAAIPGLLGVPTLANMVEGGRTPVHTAGELEQMGYAAVFFANMAMRVAGKALAQAFEVLRREGGTDSLVESMMTWDDRQDLAGLPAWLRLEKVVTAHEAGSANGTDPRSASAQPVGPERA